ncbi:RCC1 domain-containing protein [Leucobacter chinensis]|uniref:RCC1 domain-containing protein n=1 Tax=Leucobacter chinensis TaxID=2851010 RepID=UPI001C22EF11|nr:hypothetical protein [Leucobacter chinensis]
MGHNSKRIDTATQPRSKLRMRVSLALATVAVVIVGAFGVSSSFVGAITTEKSTVYGNAFEQAVRINAGPYNLRATPDEGDFFGPGTSSGTVSFDMQPEGAQALDLEKVQHISISVELPEGVEPGELPSEVAEHGTVHTWSAEHKDARWIVHSRVSIEQDGQVALPAASFAIETNLTVPVAEEALKIHATTEVSKNLVSTHPEESAVLSAAWGVNTGVYGLSLINPARSDARVVFQSHPTAEGEDLFVREGDVFTTTVLLPAGVTFSEDSVFSSSDKTSGGVMTELTSEQRGDELAVIETRTVTQDAVLYATNEAALAVSATQQLWREGFEIRAETTMPERFVSAQPELQHELSGRIPAPTLNRVSAGGGQSLALSQHDAQAYGWGVNDGGSSGVGTTSVTVTPKPIKTHTESPFMQLSAGFDHSLGVDQNGKVYGWGIDYESQVAPSEGERPISSPKPVKMHEQATFTQVSAGQGHSLALDTDGRIFGWGNGVSGQLAEVPDEYGLVFEGTPLPAPEGVQFVQAVAGSEVTIALANDGSVWGTGSNRSGQLGLGQDVTDVKTFTEIRMPDNARIVQLAASNVDPTNTHVLALTEHGEIIAWGSNSRGQAGTASTTGAVPATMWNPTFIRTPEGLSFTRVEASAKFSLAIGDDGRVYSWGGQTLGYKSQSNVTIPREIGELPDVANGYIDIAGGDGYAFALGADNALYAWGTGVDGQLGTGSSKNSDTPIPVKQDLTRDVDDLEDGTSADTEPDEAADEAAGEQREGGSQQPGTEAANEGQLDNEESEDATEEPVEEAGEMLPALPDSGVQPRVDAETRVGQQDGVARKDSPVPAGSVFTVQ